MRLLSKPHLKRPWMLLAGSCMGGRAEHLITRTQIFPCWRESNLSTHPTPMQLWRSPGAAFKATALDHLQAQHIAEAWRGCPSDTKPIAFIMRQSAKEALSRDTFTWSAGMRGSDPKSFGFLRGLQIFAFAENPICTHCSVPETIGGKYGPMSAYKKTDCLTWTTG